jgi:Flp pilus assembly protein TadG
MSRREWRLLLRGDRGSVTAVELSLGLLVLMATALLVLTLPTWIDRHAAARAAADEAARTIVLADDWETGTAQAQAIVDEVAANHGLDPGDLSLEVTGTFARGADVTAHVTVTMPAANVPLLGGIGGFSKGVSHTETVDLWRSVG